MSQEVSDFFVMPFASDEAERSLALRSVVCAQDKPPTRETPAQHAARVFTPEEVLTTAPTVRGPFVDTTTTDGARETSSEVAGVQVVLDDKDKDAAAQWNQQRIERRLRGEYERAGKQLSELVSVNSVLATIRPAL